MKHKVFAWILFIDRLNTRDMLLRRKCPINDVKCVVCQQQRETRDHLFFACSFSSICWSVLGVTWDLSLDLSERLAVANKNWGRPFYLEIAILGAWNIWKLRNRKHFDGVDICLQSWITQLKEDLIMLSCRVKTEHKVQLMVFADSIHA